MNLQKLLNDFKREVETDSSFLFYLFIASVIFVGLFITSIKSLPFFHPKTYRESPAAELYECTDDCSGHEAGYQWAKKNNITNPKRCGGKSQSFIEGCKAYAVDH